MIFSVIAACTRSSPSKLLQPVLQRDLGGNHDELVVVVRSPEIYLTVVVSNEAQT